MLNAVSAVAGGFEIIDIVIIAIFVLALCIGVAKGCAKQFRGLLGTMCALVAGVAVIVFLREQLLAISIFDTIENAILSKMSGLGAAFNNPARMSDGALQIYVDNAWIAFPDAVSNSTVKMIAQYGEGIIIKLISSRLDGVLSIAGILTSVLGMIIAYAVGFLVSVIAVKVVLAIIAAILSSIINSKKSLKRVDRVLGLVLSAAVSFVLVFAVFLVLKKFPGNVVSQKVTSLVESSSTVAKWLWELVTV